MVLHVYHGIAIHTRTTTLVHVYSFRIMVPPTPYSIATTRVTSTVVMSSMLSTKRYADNAHYLVLASTIWYHMVVSPLHLSACISSSF